ncbi:biogenesis of lysosome-related organelles complex 1 subunit 4-like [Amphiura filiformis]|uniref:biogenesis of lysosome-related organelles complex 1 subunit 4-like n=1 Tax=Amphiura filiformis TaxID=82378 RepID=UPI003B220175
MAAEQEQSSKESSPASVSPEKSNQEILVETANEYADVFTVNPQKEKLEIDEKIESMLTRLDEFCAVVDMIRTDCSLSLNRNLPEVHAKAQEMKKLFRKIDELEAFVQVVKENVALMEEQVETAESDLGMLGSIKSLLSSVPFFSQKKTTAQKKYTPPEIYKTSDYIDNVSTATPSVSTPKGADSR